MELSESVEQAMAKWVGDEVHKKVKGERK